MELKCQVGDYDGCATCKHDKDYVQDHKYCVDCMHITNINCDSWDNEGKYCDACKWEPAERKE